MFNLCSTIVPQTICLHIAAGIKMWKWWTSQAVGKMDSHSTRSSTAASKNLTVTFPMYNRLMMFERPLSSTATTLKIIRAVLWFVVYQHCAQLCGLLYQQFTQVYCDLLV